MTNIAEVEDAARSMEVTPGEKLIIERRRRGESQAEAARRLGTNETYVFLMESKKYNDGMVTVSVPVKDHERCFLYRRRSGKTTREVCKALGIDYNVLALMEKGKMPAHTLAEYWENNGESN